MKQVFLSTTTEFKEIDTLQPGTWINLVNPTQSESMEIASAFDIDIADLRAPLDAEEMSRITIEDEYTLIIVDVPNHRGKKQPDLLCDYSLGDYHSQKRLLLPLAWSLYHFLMSLSIVGFEISIPSCVRALSFKSSTATLKFI